MTSEELIRIRESKNLSKSEFANLIGVTPMLLGRYEKGSCAIPDTVAEKITGSSPDAALATQAEPVNEKTENPSSDDAGKAVSEVTEPPAAESSETEGDAGKSSKNPRAKSKKKASAFTKKQTDATAPESGKDADTPDPEPEAKTKTSRKSKKTSDAAKAVTNEEMPAEATESTDENQENTAVVENEVKKRPGTRGRKRKAEKKVSDGNVEQPSGKTPNRPSIVIQSVMGGVITVDEISKRVPPDTSAVYVRIDKNRLYYVLENGESGDIIIWE